LTAIAMAHRAIKAEKRDDIGSDIVGGCWQGGFLQVRRPKSWRGAMSMEINNIRGGSAPLVRSLMCVSNTHHCSNTAD